MRGASADRRSYKLHFRAALGHGVAIALSAPEDEAEWAGIYDTGISLLEQLSGRVSRVQFLGSSTTLEIHTRKRFIEQTPGFYQKLRGRPQLIAPVIAALGADSPDTVAVVSREPPIDIADWAGTSFGARISLFDPGEGKGLPDAASLSRNDVRELFITGLSFVPLGYRSRTEAMLRTVFEQQTGSFHLAIQTDRHTLEMDLEALAAEVPLLHVRREKSFHQISPLRSSELRAVSPPEDLWQALPEKYVPIVEAGMADRPFQCPECPDLHAPGTYLCPSGGVILDLPLNRCLLFRMQSGKIAYCALVCRSVLLSEDLLVTSDGGLYEPDGSGWRYLGPVKPFQRVIQDVWALVCHV